MYKQRRYFLNRIVAIGVSAFIAPKILLANWPKTDFAITEFDQAIRQITGGREIVEGQVTLQMPAIAENGAQVRAEVQTDLPGVKAINLLVEKNPVPLTSRFLISEHSKPYAAVNLKIRETSKVIALVETDDKFYSATHKVQVTAGGCG